MRYTWTQLEEGAIAGVIDAYGAVHSKFANNVSDIYHESEWPNCTHYRWRWNYDDGITRCLSSNKFESEHWDSIRNHLQRKYGFRFWENGYHDLDYFEKKIEEERAKNTKKEKGNK